MGTSEIEGGIRAHLLAENYLVLMEGFCGLNNTFCPKI